MQKRLHTNPNKMTKESAPSSIAQQKEQQYLLRLRAYFREKNERCPVVAQYVLPQLGNTEPRARTHMQNYTAGLGI